MLKSWLCCFVAGCIFGRLTDLGFSFFASWDLLILLVSASLAIFCRSAKWRVALISVSAFAWGFSHNVPQANGLLEDVVVVRATFPWGSPGAVFVKNGAGVFEVKGQAPIDVRGSVVCRVRLSLFGQRLCVFRGERQNAESQNIFAQLIISVRERLFSRLRQYDEPMQSWLLGVLLGDQKSFNISINHMFKDFGLYHLLVVSGLHVSLVAFFLALVLRLPGLILYSLRLIRPDQWIKLSIVLQLAALIAAMLYTFISGMNVASQRALVLFACVTLGKTFFGQMPSGRKLMFAALLQSLLYPRGILSEATVMSWGAYIFLLMPVPEDRHVLEHALRLQIILSLFFAACFGRLCLIGILFNLVVIPFFSVLLISGSLLIFGSPELLWCRVILSLHNNFLAILDLIHRFLLQNFSFLLNYLNFDLTPYPTYFAGLVVVSGYFLLNAFREVTIRPKRARKSLLTLMGKGIYNHGSRLGR